MTISLKSDASGNSGSIQVNGVDVMSFGPGIPLSNRNKIINGAFGINQRAYVSGTATTAGQYTLDRWKVTGTQGVTFSTVNNKTVVTIPTGQTLQQVIEGLNLQSGTYVLSWEGTAQGRIAGGAYGPSGITSSITGGTNTTIEFSAGTVSNVQLEVGAVATPFEYRAHSAELSMCLRYFERGYAYLIGNVYGANLFVGTFVGFNGIKRVTPTLSFSDVVENANVVAPQVSLDKNGMRFYTYGVSAGNVYYTCQFHANAEL